MANATESATIATPEQLRPSRVTIYGRDSSDGTLRPIALDASGRLIGSGGGVAPPTGDNAVNTGTSTQVASLGTLQTILAANTARYGGSVYNDDANGLYLLLGAGTVTTSVYTVLIPSGGYFEIPYGFTGVLTGLWGADGAGSARVTEYT